MSKTGRKHSKHKADKANLSPRRPTSASTRKKATNLFNEGVQMFKRGNINSAESAYRKALSLDPGFVKAHNNLGQVLGHQGKWEAAEQSYRTALQFQPGTPLVLLNLANALCNQDLFEQAEATIHQAVDIDPGFAPAYLLLADILVTLDRPDEAIDNYRHAQKLIPNAPEVHNGLGAALCMKGMLEEGVSSLNTAIKIEPHYTEAYLNIADTFNEVGEQEKAITALHTILKLDKDNPHVYTKLAQSYFAIDLCVDAKESLLKAIKISPTVADNHYLLGKVLNTMMLHDEAKTKLRKAITLAPNNSGYHFELGLILRDQNRQQEAILEFKEALRLNPDNYAAFRNLAEISGYQLSSHEIEEMEAVSQTTLSNKEKVNLNFALGMALHSLGSHDKAFHYISMANDLDGRHQDYDFNLRSNNIAKTKSLFTSAFIESHHKHGYTDATPIFIVGLPRAGKTTTEGILCRHPMVAAGGEAIPFNHIIKKLLRDKELKPFPEGIAKLDISIFRDLGNKYINELRRRFPTAKHIINTSPGNNEYVGLIYLCLPQARIIWADRVLKDACFEMYKKPFAEAHAYTYDLDRLGKHAALTRSLMEYWMQLLPEAVYKVQFEELVSDPETQIKGLIRFCGLDWDESYMDRYSDYLPAPKDVIGVWKPYEKYLSPLFENL